MSRWLKRFLDKHTENRTDKTDSLPPGDQTVGNVSSILPCPGENTPPIQVGWFISYRVGQDPLRGGPDDPQAGQVTSVQRDGLTWLVTVLNGTVVRGADITAVTQTDGTGQPILCWTTREHGLDGGLSRRRQIVDLPFHEREHIRKRYGFPPDMFQALLTGEWDDDEQVERFWS